MKRLFFLSPFISTLLGIYFYFTSSQLLICGLFFGLVMPLLSLFYGYLREFKTNNFDKTIYIIGFLGLFTDSILYIYWENQGKTTQIILTLLGHCLYISIFLRSKVLLHTHLKLDIITTSFITFFCLSIGLLIINPHISSTLFFLTALYAVNEIFLVVTGFLYFRSFDNHLVFVGVVITLLKDIIYAIYFFGFDFSILFILNNLLNVVGYCLMNIGIAYDQNKLEMQFNLNKK